MLSILKEQCVLEFFDKDVDYKIVFCLFGILWQNDSKAETWQQYRRPPPAQCTCPSMEQPWLMIDFIIITNDWNSDHIDDCKHFFSICSSWSSKSSSSCSHWWLRASFSTSLQQKEDLLQTLETHTPTLGWNILLNVAVSFCNFKILRLQCQPCC